MKEIFKKTSAWLPLAMSFMALALPLSYIAIFGTAKEPPHDEGVAAHLFQLLIGGQVFVIAYFVAVWVPEMPKPALKVLALQILAILIAFSPVYLLGL